TFRLSYECWNTPPRMLRLALRCAGIDARRFAPLRLGQTLAVPAVSPVPSVPQRCDERAIRALE
ncbi:MAG: hydrolase, partial [Pseudomonadota bacterium]|nr:hydrolase [Pseudomonadota bacterium]